MPHVDFQQTQQVIVFGIVGAAFWAVGRRLWSQILAFRSRPTRRKAAPSAKATPAPSASPLIQLQLKPPAHLKRPPAER